MNTLFFKYTPELQKYVIMLWSIEKHALPTMLQSDSGVNSMLRSHSGVTGVTLEHGGELAISL